MLTSITVDATPDAIEIPIIGSTIADSYIVKSIDGLGPPDISVVMGDLAYDGSVYQNSRVPQRNPVIQLGLNPDYSQNQTVDDLRDALYLTFLEPAGADAPFVKVTLHDNAKPDRTFLGTVDKFEMVHFDKNPEVQISLLCPDPFLKGTLISAVPVIVDKINVNNPGTRRSGFDAVMTMTGNNSGFRLHQGDSVATTPMFEIVYQFLVGDVLEINTIPGQRVVRRQRDGVWLNIIDKLTPTTIWPTFKPGDNLISATVNNMTWQKLEFTPLWWGV